MDIMTPNPRTIRLEQVLREALEIMDEVGCHHLPVMSRDGHLIGILSDRDCRSALNSPYILREDWDDELSKRLAVRVLMTAAPIVIPPEAPAEEAARLMLEHRISCLPVMRDETLVGIITRTDIVSAFITMNQSHAYIPVNRR